MGATGDSLVIGPNGLVHRDPGRVMPDYCVNRQAQSNGDHEVHDLSSTKRCLPDPVNRIALGWHASCTSAVEAAKRQYSQVNGCFYCAPACHTT